MTDNNELIVPEGNSELALPSHMSRNPAVVYLLSLSASGRRTQKHALDMMSGILTGVPDCFALPWQNLRYAHTMAIRTKLTEQYSPATVNKFLSALRGVLKAAWRLGLIDAEDYQRAIDVPTAIGETLPAGRELQSGELAALMAACAEDDDDPAGVRDAAMIALLYSTGLRRQEIVSLDVQSYDRDTGRLSVLGKRNKERLVYVTGGAKDALDDWLEARGRDDGPLFVAVNRGGHLIYRRLSDQAVYYVLSQRAKMAGVKKFSPHDMRRTFVSDLLDAGADISTVAKMAGHANVQTTMRYDRRSEQAKQKAAGLLHVPYRKKDRSE